MTDTPEPLTSAFPVVSSCPAARLESLVDAAARASMTLMAATEALQAELVQAALAANGAAATAVPASLRVPQPALAPLISEDEFGAWSRLLIERRVDGCATGGGRCGS